MKYYITNFEETIDGYENTSQVLFEAKTPESLFRKMNKFAKTWRGDGEKADDGHYEFEAGCIWLKFGYYREIPKEHYDVLAIYLTAIQ